MKRSTLFCLKCSLATCLLLSASLTFSERAAASNLQGVVDDFDDLMYFRFFTTEPFTSSPTAPILFSSTGFVSGEQRTLPGNMMWLDGISNDDGAFGPSFIEVDPNNIAVRIALSFDFMGSPITGTMEGNPAVTFDYSSYSTKEQEILEKIAERGIILEHQGTGGEDMHLVIVPEPATWMLLAVSIVAPAWRRVYARPG